jgi:hypothetical protein
MSSKTRGENIKGDFAKGGLLSKIPTSSVVKEQKRHAIYYGILDALDYDSLAPLQKPIAILFASEYCRCLPDCRNEDNRQPADYGQLLKLYNALQPKEQRPKVSTATIEDKTMNLQEILSNLDNDA